MPGHCCHAGRRSNRRSNFTSSLWGYSNNYGDEMVGGYYHDRRGWSSSPQDRRQNHRNRFYYTSDVERQSRRQIEDSTDYIQEPDPEKILIVENVDLKIAANCHDHHTSDYDISQAGQNPKLVARRGKPINIDVKFSKPYDPAKDELKLIVKAGQNPLKSKKTLVSIVLSDEDVPNEWGAKILEQKGNTLSITVFTPPSAFVGIWKLNIEVVEKDDPTSTVYAYEHTSPIYLLFNPWCKEDGVYLDKEDHLQEYVMSESGCIFTGSEKSISLKPWNFGQFEEGVLEVAMYLLDSSEVNWGVRGSPVAVTRKLTALVNSSDDGGVLVGNWSGNYKGGRSPLSWTGSPAILKKYWEDKKPVRFGQCWVFSGVTTTLMRALGIPARSVTNFSSAHDTDGSITIDYHFNEIGEPEEDLNEDSIWNFHVWNEVWMSRPDLPKGYGGWQVVDATPQEASGGIYVCGPASVQAIKQGEVNLPYDTPFVFAEVNADCCYWVYNTLDGDYSPVQFGKNNVGRFISTKESGSYRRDDITNNYKPKEGSAEERSAVRRANQTGSTRDDIYKTKDQDIVFEVSQDSAKTWVGQDFVVSLKIKNSSQLVRTIQGRVVIKTMFYTGVTADTMQSEKLSTVPIELQPGKECVIEKRLSAEDYLDSLKDCCMLDVTYWARVSETNQVFTSKENFRLRKPHLTIKAPKETVKDQEITVDISFVNPLDRDLTECSVEIDGLSKELSFPQKKVVAGGTFKASLPITATKKGKKELVAVFNSRQLEDINGSHTITIRAA